MDIDYYFEKNDFENILIKQQQRRKQQTQNKINKNDKKIEKDKIIK